MLYTTAASTGRVFLHDIYIKAVKERNFSPTMGITASPTADFTREIEIGLTGMHRIVTEKITFLVSISEHQPLYFAETVVL